MVSSETPKLPTDTPVRRFPIVWKLLLFQDSLSRMGLYLYDLCLCFCLSYFVLSPFEEIGLPFWVSGILCQHSEVVLWKLLDIQMIFWKMYGGESGLPVLFLRHLQTALNQIQALWRAPHTLNPAAFFLVWLLGLIKLQPPGNSCSFSNFPLFLQIICLFVCFCLLCSFCLIAWSTLYLLPLSDWFLFLLGCYLRYYFLYRVFSEQGVCVP